MKKLIALTAILLSAPVISDERAEIMANPCAACHGTAGKVENSAFMPLAGIKAEVFVKTMKEFRTGERDSTLMRGLALAYTDQELEAMAGYFESLPKGGEK